jgi:type IV pilus assembly protein PilN
VKPIHLNLAARPYRDYRPVYAVIVVLSLLAAFLMLNNVDTYLRYIRETKTTRAKIENLEAEAVQEQDRAEYVQNRIKGLDLARLNRQTTFINAKLRERAFSWSALLSDLESVVADDVRLLNVAPAFQPDGNIALHMSFQTKSSDGMLTTIKKMQNNPRFIDPFPNVESAVPGAGYEFSLRVGYIPRQPGQPETEIVRTSSGAAR